MVRRFFYLGSGPGSLATCLSMVSCHKRLIINITSDSGQIENVPAFIQLFNKRLQSMGLVYDPKIEGID
jgi:hypothetical protein